MYSSTYYWYYSKYDLNWKCQSTNTIISDNDIQDNMEKTFRNLNVQEKDIKASSIEIEEDILEAAAKMFSYLVTCPKNQKLIGLYKDIFKSSSTKEIILAINAIQMYASNLEKIYARKIWNKMLEILNLNLFDNIEKMNDEINNKTNFYQSCPPEAIEKDEACNNFLNILGNQ